MVYTRMEEPGGGWRWRLSTKTSVDKSLLVNFFFAFRDVSAECALVGSKLCNYQLLARSVASKQHLLEGWRVTIQLLTAFNQRRSSLLKIAMQATVL